MIQSLKEEQARTEKVEREKFELELQVEKLQGLLSDRSSNASISRLQETVIQKEMELRASRGEAEMLRGRVKALTFELEQSRKQSQQDMDTAGTKTARLISRQQGELDHAKAQISNSARQVEALQHQLASQANSKDPAIRALVERTARDGRLVSECTSKISTLTRENQEVREANEFLAQQLQHCADKLAESISKQQTVDQIARDRDEYRNTLGVLQKERKIWIAEHEEVVLLRDELRSARTEATDTAKMLAEEINRLVSDQNELKMEAERAKQAFDELSRQTQVKQDLAAELGNMTSECEVLRAQKAKLTSALVSITATFSRLEHETVSRDHSAGPLGLDAIKDVFQDAARSPGPNLTEQPHVGSEFFG